MTLELLGDDVLQYLLGISPSLEGLVDGSPTGPRAIDPSRFFDYVFILTTRERFLEDPWTYFRAANTDPTKKKSFALITEDDKVLAGLAPMTSLVADVYRDNSRTKAELKKMPIIPGSNSALVEALESIPGLKYTQKRANLRVHDGQRTVGVLLHPELVETYLERRDEEGLGKLLMFY